MMLKENNAVPAKWFISDTHFSHKNIIGYTGRPFQTVDEMDKTLMENWNESIRPEDTVFFLGDFGLGSSDFLTDLCSRLHGYKICIRGNHDGTPAKMHKIGFSLVLESAFIKIGRHVVELIHIPSHPAPAHFQLHGHVHEKRPNQLVDGQLNLSVEVWDYKPVAEKTIVALLDGADRIFVKALHESERPG
jgi:calcineurin-like phosphoesterase family protein